MIIDFTAVSDIRLMDWFKSVTADDTVQPAPDDEIAQIKREIMARGLDLTGSPLSDEHPMNSTKPYVICHDCGDQHEAEYSHEGQFGEGAIYAVVCGEYVERYHHSAVIFPEGKQ